MSKISTRSSKQPQPPDQPPAGIPRAARKSRKRDLKIHYRKDREWADMTDQIFCVMENSRLEEPGHRVEVKADIRDPLRSLQTHEPLPLSAASQQTGERQRKKPKRWLLYCKNG